MIWNWSRTSSLRLTPRRSMSSRSAALFFFFLAFLWIKIPYPAFSTSIVIVNQPFNHFSVIVNIKQELAFQFFTPIPHIILCCPSITPVYKNIWKGTCAKSQVRYLLSVVESDYALSLYIHIIQYYFISAWTTPSHHHQQYHYCQSCYFLKG